MRTWHRGRLLTMLEVGDSRTFEVSAEALWAVVSDPARLSDWVPTLRLARPSRDGEVHVEGESHGHPYDLTSPLEADQGSRRLEWGAGDGTGYRGWLEVSPREKGAEVRVHVSVPEERLGNSDAAVAEIRRGMAEAFDRLSAAVAR